jgi:hypothetical protein
MLNRFLPPRRAVVSAFLCKCDPAHSEAAPLGAHSVNQEALNPSHIGDDGTCTGADDTATEETTFLQELEERCSCYAENAEVRFTHILH